MDGKYATYENIAKSELKNTYLTYKTHISYVKYRKGG